MEGQRYVQFPAEVHSFLTGEEKTEPVELPLFRELNEEEEQAFRTHARENYVVGAEIKEIYHLVWQDEAHKMNAEAGLE